MRREAGLGLLAVALVAGLAGSAAAEEEARSGLGSLGMGADRREPITLTAATLEYDHKAGVVVYSGGVTAVQGAVTVTSDSLRVTLARDPQTPTDDAARPGLPAVAGEGAARIREIVAEGHVRIDQGKRFATGGRAIFDQERRQLVLTDDPVLHDGPNQVAGARVVVYLDEDRSVVEGGRGRVKAVLFPGSTDGRAARKDPAAVGTP